MKNFNNTILAIAVAATITSGSAFASGDDHGRRDDHNNGRDNGPTSYSPTTTVKVDQHIHKTTNNTRIDNSTRVNNSVRDNSSTNNNLNLVGGGSVNGVSAVGSGGHVEGVSAVGSGGHVEGVSAVGTGGAGGSVSGVTSTSAGGAGGAGGHVEGVTSTSHSEGSEAKNGDQTTNVDASSHYERPPVSSAMALASGPCGTALSGQAIVFAVAGSWTGEACMNYLIQNSVCGNAYTAMEKAINASVMYNSIKAPALQRGALPMLTQALAGVQDQLTTCSAVSLKMSDSESAEVETNGEDI